ncbi:hypothetical protein BSL78_02207 [Apostichopus japonicus]|uniref:Uncharacterized protein n=1 Tax=Stichopus japonicus TaxID=307972 RepID=A0A2G8LKW3_STIJA|nr:hypothetical protein BSL78_02207 [Apostichopus japonicus]
MMHRLLMVVILSDREDASPHLERLVNCNVAIPAAWHTVVPFSPSLKSKAFLVKKMMDGFFEPQDMSQGNNSSVVKLFPLQMEAIRCKLAEFPHILKESPQAPFLAKSQQAPFLRSSRNPLSCEVAAGPFPAKSPQPPLRRSRHKPHLHVKSEVAARSLQASLRRSRGKPLSCEVAASPFPAKSPQAHFLRSRRRPLSGEVTATPFPRSRHKPHLHVKSEVAARSLQASLRRSRRKPLSCKSRCKPLSCEVAAGPFPAKSPQPPLRRSRHKPHLHVKSEVAATTLQLVAAKSLQLVAARAFFRQGKQKQSRGKSVTLNFTPVERMIVFLYLYRS